MVFNIKTFSGDYNSSPHKLKFPDDTKHVINSVHNKIMSAIFIFNIHILNTFPRETSNSNTLLKHGKLDKLNLLTSYPDSIFMVCAQPNLEVI